MIEDIMRKGNGRNSRNLCMSSKGFHSRYAFAVIFSSLVFVIGCGGGDNDSDNDNISCGAGEVVLGDSCVCDNTNGYYGDAGSCAKCEGDDKAVKGNECVCADNYEEDGNGGCKAKEINDTNSCGANEVISGKKCVCDNTNGYYGDAGSCAKCEGDNKVIKGNQCVCADNYEEDGNGGCKAKDIMDTNECGANEVKNGNNCVCDNTNGYYGDAGSCAKCEGDNKVVKGNQCICADNYEEDGNGGCKAKDIMDTNECGANEVKSGDSCVCDNTNGYYGVAGSCAKCEGVGKIYADGACGCDSANGWISGSGNACVCNTDAGWTGSGEVCACNDVRFGGQCVVRGKTMSFGKYPQATDTPEPIEWIVLEVKQPTQSAKGRLLLLSKYVIDARAFDSEAFAYPEWEKSDIRKWLNDTEDSGFLSSSWFSAQEISQIIEVTNQTKYTLMNGNPQTEETQEKVFLLSTEDAANTAYFADDDARKVKATWYAVKQGALVDTTEGTNGVCANGQCTSFWWLRSPYPISNPKPQPPYVGSLLPACVWEDGIVGESGPDDDRIGVRPALWVEY